MPLSLLSWFLSFLPVLTVMVLMLGFKWGGTRASVLGWLAAVLVSVLAFGATWQLLAYAQVKAILLSLDVLYIVWGALLLFNVAKEGGAIKAISAEIPGLSSDPGLQILFAAWIMPSFFQGMGGFGVPIAVCAPILVGMGFSPVKAVVMTALGHAWAVNFGSMAAAFQSLLAVSGVAGELLAPYTAMLLGLALIPTGITITVLGRGWKGLRHTFPAIVVVSLVMGLGQYLLAVNDLWGLSATGAAILGLGSLLLLAHLPRYKQAAAEPEQQPAGHTKHLLVLLGPYLVLIIIGFSVILIKPLNAFLSQVSLTLQFPQLSTTNGWQTPAEAGRSLRVFSHPGSILLYSVLISTLIYRRHGILTAGSGKRILQGVQKSAVDASLGVIAMVGVATIMTHAGMTNLLAKGLSQNISKFVYPAIVPFVGVLGAFLTGSNNNSNVLFAQLQMETAKLMGLNIPLILSAQTAGGSLGSVMSPAKIIVGCSTVGLTMQEGKAMGKIVLLGMIPVLIIAIATLIWSWVLIGGG